MEKFVQGTGVGQGDGRFKTMAETLVRENSARLDSVLQTSMANAHQVQLATCTIAADAKNPLNIDPNSCSSYPQAQCSTHSARYHCKI
jgi:hypothetical protein